MGTFSKRYHRGTVGKAAIIIVLFLVSCGLYAASDSDVGTVTGKIELVDHSANTIKVNGLSLALASSSIVRDEKGDIVTIDSFKKGYTVGIRFLLGNGSQPYVVKDMSLISKYSSYQIPMR
ncbi:hypothetical protein [Sedimenticola sp.]|uniref:hypothetical protein n=1 Tax=Sedimenticola sp. TaxID=1940285 RepID=UPI003D0AC60E